MDQKFLLDLVKTINNNLLDVLMYTLLIGGLFFSFKFKFPQITRIGPAFKQTFGGLFKKKDEKEGSMSSFQALATAIAAQVGTGNVAGVATAILIGGPGAIFWMWVSAFLGMSTIFCEAVLAQHFREKKDGELVGGPAYYLKKGIKGPAGKVLSVFFAASLILALGLIGNMVQSNSIASAIVKVSPSIPSYVIGIIIAILAALVFFGGMKRIASFAELVVPVMAVIYLIGSIAILVMFHDMIIPTFSMIFNAAFSGFEAGLGGIAGVTVKIAVQKGVARGLFSNEAGMGSTPHAHAVADVKHPVEQGLTAMVGVFIDTVLVCTATALVILVTKSYNILDEGGKFLQGANLTQGAFETAFGGAGAIFLAVCLSFFAFTTIVGWYYFGESNIKFLFGTKGLLPYRTLVCGFIILGAIFQVDLVWALADLFNSIMVVPNIIGLMILSGIAGSIIRDYDKKKLENNIRYEYPEA